MIAALLDAAARHRRAVVIGGVVAAVALAWMTVSAPRRIWIAALAWLVVVLLQVVTDRRERPARFVVRPERRTFSPPAYGAPALRVVAQLLWLGSFVHQLQEPGALPWGIGIGGMSVVVVGSHLWHAWDGHEVVLNPEGLHHRRLFGTLFVPWTAVAAARLTSRRARPPVTSVVPPGAFHPAEDVRDRDRPAAVRLRYAQPGLVLRRGVIRDRGRLDLEEIDPGYLAEVINFYVAHPGHRAGIGTVEGHRTLQQALGRSGA
ncbi:PH domain-containing protein [Krasilnikovia sp. MM14-A1259]|uniref:PH domain-containing protein n=1 Tax=Krasilnikovia sp. MM14-A1259 TaxID=3373539 RepID=UPI00399C9532